MQTSLMLTVAVFLAAQLAPVAALAQRRGAEPFMNVRAHNVEGRVGHHLIDNGQIVNTSDLPAGNTGDWEGSCQMSGWIISHEPAPPGMVVNTGGGSSVFAGTPRQPGTWTVSVTFNFGCTGGPDQNRYVRAVSYRFNIQP